MLLPVLHRAKPAKYNVRLIIDKLIVNIKTYTLDNLHELLEDINPEKFSNVENDDMMLFWGKYVPLSTFHIHNFKVNQVQCSSIEQDLQYEKAMLFEDGELAGKLITEKDPLVCKMLGKQVTNFEQQKWANSCYDIVKELLEAKFISDKNLKKYLLDTGDKILACGGKYEKYWGVGLPIYAPESLDKTKWAGKNRLGEAFK